MAVKIHIAVFWVMTPGRSVTTFFCRNIMPLNSGQKMETVCSCNIFVSIYQTTWCHNQGVPI